MQRILSQHSLIYVYVWIICINFTIRHFTE